MERFGQSWATSSWLGALVGIVLSAATVVQGATAEAGGAASQLPAVRFSMPGGIYTSNVAVALKADSGAAEIHFTTDGSEPNAQSPVYSGPLQVGTTTVVKARAFQSGKGGHATCETYTLIDESLANWSSNLPLVIINTFGQNVSRDEKSHASVRIIDAGKARAALTGAAIVDSRAFVNLRGHSSLRYPKRSYHLDLRDAENQSLKASVFGFPADADWVLYAPYPDKTLMRDVLAYELSNQMGRYAPHTQFVEVFINTAPGKLSLRHYMGVYVFEEKIKRSKDRVALEKLGLEDKTEPTISGGYIFKKDHIDRPDSGPPNIGGFPNNGGPSTGLREGYPTGPGGFPGDPRGFLPSQGRADAGSSMFNPRFRPNAGLDTFVSSHGNLFLYVEPDADKINLAQRRWLSQYVHRFETALYGPDFRDPVNGYAGYLDADSFIDHHLLVEATKNIDGFRFSTYFHKDRGGKLQAGPIWDWNLSFGAANGKQGYMAEHWYWPQLDDQQYSWYRRLFEDPDFAQKYVDRWGEIRTNQFATAKILARIDQLAALLGEAQSRNYRRWKILGREVWPQYYTGKTYNDEVEYMKNWITQRLSWIDHQFIAGPAFSLPEGAINPAAKLSFRATSGKIYYTLDGSDPRAPGGAVSPRAQLYRGPIKLAGQTIAVARVFDGQRWSWPSKAKYVPN